jgi:hypothetical protein
MRLGIVTVVQPTPAAFRHRFLGKESGIPNENCQAFATLPGLDGGELLVFAEGPL